MRPKLVIFDCDGVLVDSESLTHDCLSQLFTLNGLTISPQECRRRFQGKTIEDICQDLAALKGKPHDPSFPAVVRNAVEESLAGRVEAIPGAVELVKRVIANDVLCCVASSGSRRKMELTLGPAGLLPLLKDVLFSAQEVGRGKPHPDVFIAAAAAMKCQAEETVIIEDSISGVTAGAAFGARVLGYAGDPLLTDPNVLAQAGAELFYDMNDVPHLIGLT